MSLPRTLSLGGGIIYVNSNPVAGSWEDFGYCNDFSLLIQKTQEYNEAYAADSEGNLLRVPTTEGYCKAIALAGGFDCESITRRRLQEHWFFGVESLSGSELFEAGSDPLILGVRYKSVQARGPTVCLTLPFVGADVTEYEPFMGIAWKKLRYKFRVLFTEEADSLPRLKVAESGESLEGFCE